MALSVDWQNASVSPTATGLLWVEVTFDPLPEGAELGLLSEALGELPRESGLIEGVHLRENLIRLHIATSADVPAVKRALAVKLEEYAEQSDRRLQQAQAQYAEIEARRAQAEASVAEIQAQFREALH